MMLSRREMISLLPVAAAAQQRRAAAPAKTQAAEADWPQWHGPQRNNLSLCRRQFTNRPLQQIYLFRLRQRLIRPRPLKRERQLRLLVPSRHGRHCRPTLLPQPPLVRQDR